MPKLLHLQNKGRHVGPQVRPRTCVPSSLLSQGWPWPTLFRYGATLTVCAQGRVCAQLRARPWCFCCFGAVYEISVGTTMAANLCFWMRKALNARPIAPNMHGAGMGGVFGGDGVQGARRLQEETRKRLQNRLTATARPTPPLNSLCSRRLNSIPPPQKTQAGPFDFISKLKDVRLGFFSRRRRRSYLGGSKSVMAEAGMHSFMTIFAIFLAKIQPCAGRVQDPKTPSSATPTKGVCPISYHVHAHMRALTHARIAFLRGASIPTPTHAGDGQD